MLSFVVRVVLVAPVRRSALVGRKPHRQASPRSSAPSAAVADFAEVATAARWPAGREGVRRTGAASTRASLAVSPLTADRCYGRTCTGPRRRATGAGIKRSGGK